VQAGGDLAEAQALQLLIDEANQKKLSETRYWHLLLHYKKGLLGGIESREDAPAFFNAPKGKTDPKAELAATLSAFFTPLDQLAAGEEHPQCNFPARLKWLVRELSLEKRWLPKADCRRLEGWLEKLNPRRITLVFASYYMNNPASMFGHTLLRIDKKGSGPDRNLLNYGVNYAATPDTENALLYALKGLFGFFKGSFSIFPYYTKVQEYNHFESRDLWEYELKLTDDQMNNFLLHLWELGDNAFDYYYFQENCSYHLLALLEVANPSLHLTDAFFFHVIPSDTVRAVTRYDALVTSRVYRPSLLSQMRHKQLQMSPEQNAAFQKIARDPNEVDNPAYQVFETEEKALILDAALDYLQYKNMKNKRHDKPPVSGSRKLLLARSHLGPQRRDNKMTQFSSLPEQGHGSDRLKASIGLFENRSFEEISYRPAYHDLLGQETGYAQNSQILFLDVTARYYEDSDGFKLERLNILDIVSLTPYDSLFQKKSWRFGFGVDTIKDIDCGLCHAFKVDYGIGLSYQPTHDSRIFFYGLADFKIELAGGLEEGYRAGGGGRIGLLYRVSGPWRVQILANALSFPLGHRSDYYRIALNQRFALSQNFALRFEASRLKQVDEWLFSTNYYF